MAGFLVTGCVSGSKILRESSNPTRPAWIEKIPQNEQTIYVVGIHTGGESLAAAQEAAIKDALSKIAQYVGINIQSEFQEHTTELAQHVSRSIQSKSQAYLLGVAPEDWYYEKLSRLEKNFSMERYDVYVLVKYAKVLAEKERDRQSESRKSLAMNALEMYRQGKLLNTQLKRWQAAQKYKSAVKILESLDQNVMLPDLGIDSSQNLLTLAKNNFNDTMRSLRQYTLDVKVAGPGQSYFTFESALKAGLSSCGYVLAENQASLAIAGQLVLIKSGVTLGNHVFLAEGTLSVSRKNDFQPMFTIHSSEKGFHKESERAALNAAEEAGKTAAEKIAEELKKYEQKYLEE